MRIDVALACDRVEIHDGLADLESAGWDTLSVNALPAHLEFDIYARFLGTADEVDPSATHDLEVYVLGPGMQRLYALNSAFAGPGLPDGREPGWEVPFP